MQDHIGEEFGGVIASVTNFGLFIRIDDLHIDGLIHVSSLDNDYYHFDNEKHLLIGENSRRVYRLGDKVRIRVRSVNLDERKIDLALLAAESPAGKDRMAGGWKKDEAAGDKAGQQPPRKKNKQQKKAHVKAKRAKVEAKRKAMKGKKKR